MAEPDELSLLSTMGPCPQCGRERLLRIELERLPGRMGVEAVHYIDCGHCPTLRVQALAPSDEPADEFLF